MINVSNDFKTAMTQSVKEIDAYIRGDGINITSATDLISFKISCEAGLCKTAMRKLEARLVGDYPIVGQVVSVGFGARLASQEFEYLNYGGFKITETTFNKENETTSIIGYDMMINAMTPYQPLEVTYPISLYDFATAICGACGLQLGNASFDVLNNWQITEDLFSNIDGVTYRDILVQIAQVVCATCMIGTDDKVWFKYITDTNETLTYSNLMKLKLEPVFGEINSVVLSRTPQEDNIYMRDDASIELNGLTEWKIENNEIIDKDRDNAMTPIYNAMHGITYYPFEADTEGLGWYEIGDKFTIETNDEETFECVLFNFSITIDGAIKEILKTTAETKTQTQYQYATTIAKRVKNTEIIVNKQEQYIDSLVTDMYSENGLVSENFTQVHQDINNIISSVQNTGGANLIKNSVMFAYDSDGNPNEWTVTGAGTLNITSSAESLLNGCLSGNVFTLEDKTVSQTIGVTRAEEGDTNAICYTFSCKVKKNATGTAYVKIYNSNEEYIKTFEAGESAFYKEVTFKELYPTDNYYTIELYGSADSEATFTDLMVNVGKYKSQWQQASGEVMNTQVNINVDGVLVKSSVYAGNYTVMSPLEFAGYSNKNGTITKVFTLNDDTTEVTKLKASDQIEMPPIKIVPVTSGSLQGWAFVPDT